MYNTKSVLLVETGTCSATLSPTVLHMEPAANTGLSIQTIRTSSTWLLSRKHSTSNALPSCWASSIDTTTSFFHLIKYEWLAPICEIEKLANCGALHTCILIGLHQWYIHSCPCHVFPSCFPFFFLAFISASWPITLHDMRRTFATIFIFYNCACQLLDWLIDCTSCHALRLDHTEQSLSTSRLEEEG